MSFRTLLAVVGLAVLAAPSGLLASTTYFYNALQCQPYDLPASSGGYAETTYVYSGSTFTQVTCPAMGWTASSVVVDGLTVYYTDNSNTQFYTCFPVIRNWDGSSTWGSTMYGCGTYGGCSCGTCSGSCGCASWKGGGQMNFTNPFGGNTYYPQGLSVVCTIPDANYTYSYSELAGYNFTIN